MLGKRGDSFSVQPHEPPVAALPVMIVSVSSVFLAVAQRLPTPYRGVRITGLCSAILTVTMCFSLAFGVV